MTDESAERHHGLEIDWLRAAAGALAAVASAFLLSFLGAAGTIIGAALGSLIVTVSSAVFTQGLSTSKRTLEKAQSSAARKVGIAQIVRKSSRRPCTMSATKRRNPPSNSGARASWPSSSSSTPRCNRSP